VEDQAKPSDFKVCLTCNRGLNEDERIINARFVNEALEGAKDISMFPICIKCNFDKLLSEAGKNRDRLFKHESDALKNPYLPNTF